MFCGQRARLLNIFLVTCPVEAGHLVKLFLEISPVGMAYLVEYRNDFYRKRPCASVARFTLSVDSWSPNRMKI